MMLRVLILSLFVFASANNTANAATWLAKKFDAFYEKMRETIEKAKKIPILGNVVKTHDDQIREYGSLCRFLLGNKVISGCKTLLDIVVDTGLQLSSLAAYKPLFDYYSKGKIFKKIEDNLNEKLKVNKKEEPIAEPDIKKQEELKWKEKVIKKATEHVEQWLKEWEQSLKEKIEDGLQKKHQMRFL